MKIKELLTTFSQYHPDCEVEISEDSLGHTFCIKHTHNNVDFILSNLISKFKIGRTFDINDLYYAKGEIEKLIKESNSEQKYEVNENILISEDTINELLK